MSQAYKNIDEKYDTCVTRQHVEDCIVLNLTVLVVTFMITYVYYLYFDSICLLVVFVSKRPHF